MTTEYHDNMEDDSSSFWNKEPRPGPLSRVSRSRRWLFMGLGAAVILILIIVVSVTNTQTMSRLSYVDTTVSNLTKSQSSTQQLSKETAKGVQRLKFAVESNKDQLTSVSEALKQLSALDTISRTVANLKCTMERYMNNGTTSAGCCPLGWENLGTSCYFFSKTTMPWHDARDWCNGHESHLVILMSDDEWTFVTRMASGNFYWIGLSDEKSGQWEWVNETPYVMNRRRWKPGQPDSWTGHGLGSGDEDCAHLHNDGRLNDLHCSTRLPFICQRHTQDM
ncbi:asialoglycoprotein receptor 1 [Nematolebias whitei]|uniref:asialoglycoprotein receptor 1 n=1 Tax=Nematolebias whitei TaxID=451745 RepID=UPI00189A6A71|nr:asialoglycoprotein receptor 1 [Nematolebias whitei]